LGAEPGDGVLRPGVRRKVLRLGDSCTHRACTQCGCC
jgi:hypothetical protein